MRTDSRCPSKSDGLGHDNHQQIPATRRALMRDRPLVFHQAPSNTNGSQKLFSSRSLVHCTSQTLCLGRLP